MNGPIPVDVTGSVTMTPAPPAASSASIAQSAISRLRLTGSGGERQPSMRPQRSTSVSSITPTSAPLAATASIVAATCALSSGLGRCAGKLPSGARLIDTLTSAPSGASTSDAKKPPAPEPGLTQIFIPASGVASSLPAAARTAPFSFSTYGTMKPSAPPTALGSSGGRASPSCTASAITSFTSFLFSPRPSERAKNLRPFHSAGRCDAVTITEPAMSLDGASSDSSITGVVPAPTLHAPAPRQKASEISGDDSRGSAPTATRSDEPSHCRNATPIQYAESGRNAFGAPASTIPRTSSFAAAASALSDASVASGATPARGNAVDAPIVRRRNNAGGFRDDNGTADRAFQVRRRVGAHHHVRAACGARAAGSRSAGARASVASIFQLRCA